MEIIYLCKTIMKYYQDIQVEAVDHMPRCSILLDRKFNFWALNFCASGTIEWSVDGGRRTRLTGPVAYWTEPGRRYRYGCGPDEEWDQYYVMLRGEGSRRMFREGLAPGRPPRSWCPVRDPEGFRQLWRGLLDAFISRPHRPAECAHRVQGLFLFLHRPEPDPVGLDRFRVLETSVERWQKMPPGSIRWDKEARQLGWSTVHLRRVFKKRFGQPPHQYLLQLRLEQAARFLRTTTLTVKDVAAECGFDDLYHFSKLMRARFGLSPRAYRAEMALFEHRQKTS